MLEVILINATGHWNTGSSVEFMFDHTCNFRIPANGLDPEELELELIDFGAEEVLKMKTDIDLWCFCQFWNHPKELENRNLEILSSGFERILKSLKN
jgi:transcriptional/translational regulatory protein YebC/TACO1